MGGLAAHSSANTVLGGSGIQERTRSSKDKLGRYSQENLQGLGLTWKRGEAAALDRQGWRRLVAHCVYMDSDLINVKVRPKYYENVPAHQQKLSYY